MGLTLDDLNPRTHTRRTKEPRPIAPGLSFWRCYLSPAARNDLRRPFAEVKACLA